MLQIPQMDDRRCVIAQYRTTSNLKARIALHQRFSTNPYGWLRGVFDQFRLPLQCCLVELGGGTGDLWVENQSRIPTGWAITLSDASMGMVSYARQCLRSSEVALTFAVVDAQALPFATASMDAAPTLAWITPLRIIWFPCFATLASWTFERHHSMKPSRDGTQISQHA
jgi:hypothetical protein